MKQKVIFSLLCILSAIAGVDAGAEEKLNCAGAVILKAKGYWSEEKAVVQLKAQCEGAVSQIQCLVDAEDFRLEGPMPVTCFGLCKLSSKEMLTRE